MDYSVLGTANLAFCYSFIEINAFAYTFVCILYCGAINVCLTLNRRVNTGILSAPIPEIPEMVIRPGQIKYLPISKKRVKRKQTSMR